MGIAKKTKTLGKSYGMNVWLKSALIQEKISVTNPTFSLRVMPMSTDVTLTTSSFDCTKIQNLSDFLSGFTTTSSNTNLGGFPQITYSYGVLKIFFDYSYSVTITKITSNSSTSMTLTLESAYEEESKNISMRYIGEKVLQELIVSDIGFVINDNPYKYPDEGVHIDGYYYSLFGQIASANSYGLSNGLLEKIKDDTITEIEEAVINGTDE